MLGPMQEFTERIEVLLEDENAVWRLRQVLHGATIEINGRFQTLQLYNAAFEASLTSLPWGAASPVGGALQHP